MDSNIAVLILLAADGDKILSEGLSECVTQLQAFAAAQEAPARDAWLQLATQVEVAAQELATRAASLKGVHAELSEAPTFAVVWDGMLDGKQIGVLDAPGTSLERFIGQTVKIIPTN